MELIRNTLRATDLILRNLFRGPSWPTANELVPVASGFHPSIFGTSAESKEENDLQQKKEEGFLWGVPKRRVTVETRTTKKFGLREWHWKLFDPKTNLRICDTCGHHYEAKHLCRNCYERVKAETSQMREAAESQLGDSPEDKSLIFVYENEDRPSKSAQNKLIVELEKPRPNWFSRNLLQRTTTGPDTKTTTVTVTPKNLG